MDLGSTLSLNVRSLDNSDRCFCPLLSSVSLEVSMLGTPGSPKADVSSKNTLDKVFFGFRPCGQLVMTLAFYLAVALSLFPVVCSLVFRPASGNLSSFVRAIMRCIAWMAACRTYSVLLLSILSNFPICPT